MAEFMLGLAKSAVEGTVSMARSAVKEDKNLKKAVKRDLMIISDEFEMMQAFLEDAKGLVTDNVTTTMVRQVRNMALDVEDCIEWVVHFDDKSNWWHRMVPPCLPSPGPAADLDAVVADMELLKARVEAMGHWNSRYSRIGDSGPKPCEQAHHHQASANATTSDIFANLKYAAEKQGNQIDLVELINKRDTHFWGKMKEVVEKDKGVRKESKAEKQVEEAPFHSSPSSAADVLQLQVISVLGTRNDLAMMVVKKAYDNEETCQSFTCRAWVKLMHPFNPQVFMRSLLAQKHNKHCPEQKDTIDGALIAEFEEQISNHKYLVVLEDVSTMADWEAVRVYLPDKNNGSCIIVCTQLPGTASLCVEHPHRVWELEKFSTDHSVYVFCKQVKGFDFRSNVRPIIVQKCGGLAKALCAVAGMSRNYSFWDSLMKDNLVSTLAPDGEPFMTEDDADLRREKLQELSVWLLPYFRSCPDYLKPCIFYLSIFPLNHRIRPRRLVRRWVAEGYSRDDKESTAEENGEMSFAKLVSLSMAQVLGIDDWRTHLCRVNGFIREFMFSRSMEDNLVFTLEDNTKKGLQCTGRHLAIYESWDRDRNVFESIDFSRLRSMTVFGQWKSFFISDKMRLLRVLDLEDVCSGLTNRDIDRIVKLLPRLKFLSLRRCREITHLPDSLGDLKQLQTLDIRDTSVTKLPETIIKLEKLQYMRAGSSVTMDNHAGTEQDSAQPPPGAENPSSSAADTSMVERHPQSSPAPPEADNSPLLGDDNGMVERSPPTAQSRPGATLGLNWLSKLFIQHRPDDDGHGSRNGVKFPRGIGNLSNMHTLGVVNISAADNQGRL